jgi:methionyl-tRNA synthetase
VLRGKPINKFKALLQRVDMDKVNAIIDDSRENLAPKQAPANKKQSPAAKKEAAKTKNTNANASPLEQDPIGETVSFEDFAKVDLRVARIAKAEHVEKADKLLRLELDLGGETKQVFAGIKSACGTRW